MVNSDNNKPWYPYYVQWMLGSRLNVGDPIVDSASSSDEVRVLAWIHEGKLNIFLICIVEQPRTIFLSGVSEQLAFVKIDNTISWENPSLQTGVFNATNPLILNGYTVMCLQKD